MTPQEEFEKMLDYSGLTAWHEAGYRGRGINILNCESMEATHGAGTGTILKRCAFEAVFHCGDLSVNTQGDLLTSAVLTVDGKDYDLAEYIRIQKIDILTCSRTGRPNKGWTDYCEELQVETGVIIFNSAGNESASTKETLFHMFPASVALLVGAVNLDLKRINYSSVGEELDFMAFSGLIGGTSAASPFLAGMTACIFSKYGKMSPVATKEYLKSISKDLGTAGDDIYYGEGMPILGNPETIIKIKPGDNFMLVDNNVVILDSAAVIIKGRIMVPVRAIAESLGGTANWDENTKTATIVR